MKYLKLNHPDYPIVFISNAITFNVVCEKNWDAWELALTVDSTRIHLVKISKELTENESKQISKRILASVEEFLIDDEIIGLELNPTEADLLTLTEEYLPNIMPIKNVTKEELRELYPVAEDASAVDLEKDAVATPLVSKTKRK